jgi:hypothetical protein
MGIIINDIYCKYIHYYILQLTPSSVLISTHIHINGIVAGQFAIIEVICALSINNFVLLYYSKTMLFAILAAEINYFYFYFGRIAEHLKNIGKLSLA